MSDGRRYRIIEVIGKGGFGTVYRAEMQGEGGFAKNVALKLLNSEASEIEEIASRLRDEARILGLIHHRAIVRVDGLTTLEGRWAVVMEYVDGVDLRHVLAAGPVPPGPAVEIIGEVAGALYVAHDKPTPDGQPLRLLHRDIKPSNLQITPSGEVKILDFGVARAEFQSREAHTQGMRFGTLRYLAPERLDGIDSAAGDIYALGVVLIECLTGKSFGKAIANRSAHQKRVEDALNRVWSQTRGVSQELVDVCEAMVAYDPNQRLSARDVERVCKELRAILQDDWLGDWAEGVIPPLLEKRRAKTKSDKLCGSTITESTSGSASGYWQKGDNSGVTGQRDVDFKGDADEPSMIFSKGGQAASAGNLYRQTTEEAPPPVAVEPPQPTYDPTPQPAPQRAPQAAMAAAAGPVTAPQPQAYVAEDEGTSSRGKTGLLVGVAGVGLLGLLGLLLVGGIGAAWYTGALDGVLGGAGSATTDAVAAAPPPPPPPGEAMPDAASVDQEAPADAGPAATRDTGGGGAATTSRSTGGYSSGGSASRSTGDDVGGSSASRGDGTSSGGGSMARSSEEGSAGSVRPVDEDGAADAADAAVTEGDEEAFDPEAEEDLSLCSNLLNLELMAGMGKLRSEHITCLEKYINRADSLNDKDKASRVLIANAQASNNKSRWEMLVKRHLEEFDRSDPELAYGYAVSLSKKGSRGANGAIRWSDVALENRSVWTGKTHMTRVNTLYQIKAMASLALYQQTAEKFAETPSQELSKAEEKYRNQTKTYAREWFEYAKASGQDTTRAKALCDETAGSTTFCE